MESIQHRVHIDLRPRIDLTFRAALERACVAASLAGAELDTPDAARIVEEDLRSGGYPNAEISLFRSVEEYRNRTSNWVAWRDGRPHKRTEYDYRVRAFRIAVKPIVRSTVRTLG